MEHQHALKGMNRYLTCTLLPQHINDLLQKKNFKYNQGGKRQVERPYQNLEYIQNFPYHRNFLVNHHYRKPHQTHPSSFVN